MINFKIFIFFYSTVSSSNFSYPKNVGLISLIKRNRCEKRPIPNEQKDAKYFERRRRNNEAAKKSRDARKLREDQVLFRNTHYTKK